MDFVTVRELRGESARIWEKLDQGEEIVLTRNGKPFAVLVSTRPEEVEETVRAIRAERLGSRLRHLQGHALERGLDQIREEEIAAEIAASRQERHAGGR